MSGNDDERRERNMEPPPLTVWAMEEYDRMVIELVAAFVGVEIIFSDDYSVVREKVVPFVLPIVRTYQGTYASGEYPVYSYIRDLPLDNRSSFKTSVFKASIPNEKEWVEDLKDGMKHMCMGGKVTDHRLRMPIIYRIIELFHPENALDDGISLFDIALFGLLADGTIADPTTRTRLTKGLQNFKNKNPERFEKVPKATMNRLGVNGPFPPGFVPRQDPLDPAPLLLGSFKKDFSNQKNRQCPQFLSKFWRSFDPDKMSFYSCKYDKLPEECTVDFVTANQLKGFMHVMPQQMANVAMGVMHVLGSGKEYDIEGVWLFDGQKLPDMLQEHRSFGFYKWEKLNEALEMCKCSVNEMFFYVEGKDIGKRPVFDTCCFK